MKKHRFLILTMLAAVVIAAVPFVYAVATTPAGFSYSGRHSQNTGDYGVYFSQMEQARQGHLLFYNLYETTPHNANIFNPFWLVLGWLCRITGIAIPIMFHAFRLLLIPLLVLVTWKVVTYFVSDVRIQRIALLLCLFAGGFAGYATTTDATPFMAMQFSPHLVASLILLELIFLWCAKAIDAFF